MKYILMAICLTVLIFTVTSGVLAEGSVAIDYIPGGGDVLGADHLKSASNDSKTQTGKLDSYFISFDGLAGSFKYGIDYGNGTDEFKSGDIISAARKFDFNMTEYRIGARILDLERVKLDLMFSKLQLQLKDSASKINEDGNMLGCDVKVPIYGRMSFDGYLGYSLLGGSYEENGKNYDTSFIVLAKTRLNYALSDHMALSFGFREIFCKVSDYNDGQIDGLWRGIGGFSIGAKYSF